MSEFLQAVGTHPFLRNALLAGFLASIACGMIGTYVVVRRITLIAGSLGHAVLGGMGAAYYVRVAHGVELLHPLHGAIAAALVGANYGSNLSLFPSATKDYYGLKNFGVNYGLVFTAWGIGGFMLAKFAGWVYDGAIVASWKGSFNFAYYTSAALLVVAAGMTFLVKTPHHREAPVEHSLDRDSTPEQEGMLAGTGAGRE